MMYKRKVSSKVEWNWLKKVKALKQALLNNSLIEVKQNGKKNSF